MATKNYYRDSKKEKYFKLYNTCIVYRVLCLKPSEHMAAIIVIVVVLFFVFDGKKVAAYFRFCILSIYITYVLLAGIECLYHFVDD